MDGWGIHVRSLESTISHNSQSGLRWPIIGQACAAGGQDRFGPVGDLQLGQDVGHMVGDRLGSEVQCLTDRGVVLTVGDEGQDVPLAIGELWKHHRPGRRRVEPIEEAFGGPWAEDDVTASGSPDCVHDVVLAGPFEEVSAGTGPEVSVALGRHGERWFMLTLHYPLEFSDGFVPRAQRIVDDWRWADTGQGF